MAKISQVLGMNARNQLFVKLNSRQAKSICYSKHATKLLMESRDIPTPKIISVFVTSEDINDFDWDSLEKNFVIKPTNGHAGKGVVVFRKKVSDKKWSDAVGNIWDLEDIKIHCYDILSGQFSSHGQEHNVIIEERIPIHHKLLKYTYRGTPDIRVIVFNSVPVMAMLRLSTEESEGRANISQGAIAVGIDMATGVTTHAVAHKNKSIKYLPGTKKKLNGIIIPFWKKTLITAVRAANAAELKFSGIDIFLHEEKGPMVVELNVRPGLSIQNANKAGLKKRLERVEDLNVLNPEHGVKIAQALFAEKYSDKIMAKEGLTVIDPKIEVEVFGDEKQQEIVMASVNTGRFSSAIASELAEKLDKIDIDDLLWFQQDTREGKVPVVEVKIKINEKNIKSTMLVSKRLNKTSYKIELGRKDLAGFLVRTEENA
jgi:alpha-L-glutamate ligase-like protein